MNDQSKELIEGGRLKAREIAVTTTGVQYNNFGAMLAFANQMSKAGPAIRKDFRDNPGACLALVDDAIRYGMSPFVLARSAYVVNDQLAYQANIISAIILSRAPIKGRPKYSFEGTGKDLRCTVTIMTTDGETLTHRSPPIGQIQPQNSPLWKTDQEQQLGYYTIRAAARRHFPDIMAGVYDLEEITYAKTIEGTTETSGLVDRLQGAAGGQGFSDGHVERELGGVDDRMSVLQPTGDRNGSCDPGDVDNLSKAERENQEVDKSRSSGPIMSRMQHPAGPGNVQDDGSSDEVPVGEAGEAAQTGRRGSSKAHSLPETGHRSVGGPRVAPEAKNAPAVTPATGKGPSEEDEAVILPDDDVVDFREVDDPTVGQPAGEGDVQIPMTDEEREDLDQLAIDLNGATSSLEVGGVWAMWAEVFAHLTEPVRLLALELVDTRKTQISENPKRTRARKT